MLEQMLKKCFEEDSTAVPERDSRIKAEVLSRIESEKHMRKHFGIKPLIVAAAVSVAGVMSVALTVNASVDEKSVEEISRAAEESGLFSVYPPHSKEFQAFVEQEADMMEKYMYGRVSQAVENGGIKSEKELDDRDIVGFVPYNTEFSQGHRVGELSEEELELAHLIEEDPGALGLIPAGKTETFEGGLRIVNRHFENINEPVDGAKRYYSVRRIYTDDEENKLIASLYLSGAFEFDPEENRIRWYDQDNNPYRNNTFIGVLLDHTENGLHCGAYDLGRGSGGEIVFLDDGKKHNSLIDKTLYCTMFQSFTIKPDPDKQEVRIGNLIAVSSDGIQWID